jgi:hypothetical protein
MLGVGVSRCSRGIAPRAGRDLDRRGGAAEASRWARAAGELRPSAQAGGGVREGGTA